MLAFLLAGLGASAAALGGAQAVADGFRLLFTSASYTFAPNLYCDLPYDRVKSFKPIAMFGSSPSVLVVRASMPVRTVKGLVALARKRRARSSTGRPGSNIHPRANSSSTWRISR
jgi:tripartite-type tricarboxylate transporter receptor subunit TctC